jgi:hypothetical protein
MKMGSQALLDFFSGPAPDPHFQFLEYGILSGAGGGKRSGLRGPRPAGSSLFFLADFYLS